ncbi:SCP1.201-like deaminase [Amycolatopsis arida]|uniref:SCP1.201-like deaminase n=1 Tax=Amycolatopsis arida TaxID=587909 RepID=A0A1I5K9I8_9PSEU|nr:DddA-like double-stranded DNA deaminase toxin [Amycolatopsis arida]TDX96949.1 nucleic acid/nucleotide deaminase of polymorphic system toxin [Amycolatopsis arida]SFO81695.1 SCP1.201-like deaminase [Amycolatopsis arida]
MTIEEEANRLRDLANVVPVDALGQLLTQVEQLGNEAQQIVGYDDELMSLIGDVTQTAQDAAATMTRLQQVMRSVAARHLGQVDASDIPLATPQVASTQPPAPRSAPAVTAPDGSRYPEQGAWCADLLPPRVRVGQGDRTIGYVDGSYHQFTSGLDDTYSPQIWRRLMEKGVQEAAATFLSTHVELKVATDMIMRGKTDSELVINHQPCRARSPLRPGCDDVLEQYLPPGYTLTVHGTTDEGEPFTRTYRGKA